MPDDHAALTALATHLTVHPHLSGTVLTVALPYSHDPIRLSLHETLGATSATTDWATLRTWADTIGATTVTVIPDVLSTIYTVRGTLADDTPVEVRLARHDPAEQQPATTIDLRAGNDPAALSPTSGAGAA